MCAIWYFPTLSSQLVMQCNYARLQESMNYIYLCFMVEDLVMLCTYARSQEL